MSRTLTYGMVGGGPGAFIGDAHRRAIALDGSARLVAGCFSRSPEKSRAQGETLGLDPERCYTNYQEMARAESAREDGIDFGGGGHPQCDPLRDLQGLSGGGHSRGL